MSRRHSAEKREIQPDPKFGNFVESRETRNGCRNVGERQNTKAGKGYEQ